MDPITLRRALGTGRAVAVALAITALTSGASLPVVAATPSAEQNLSAPRSVDARGVVAVTSIGETSGSAIQAGPLADTGPTVNTLALAEADLLRDEPLTAAASRPVATTPVKPPARAVRPARTAAPASGPHGRNHVWSGSLGLDRSVRWFPCSRSRPPGPAVYRWGCAGTNNVYLFAHAGGPFQRLHDLYVRGSLRRGMTVAYADAGGRVHRFAIAWWKVVLPTAGDFAFAAQSRPSMTLQTCVGPHDSYRLVVRLYQAD